MMKTLMATTLLAASAIATPASAVTYVTDLGSISTFAPTSGTLVDFNSDTLPTGFTLNGVYALATGSSSSGATPGNASGP